MSRSRWFGSGALGLLAIVAVNGFAAGVPSTEPARIYLHKDWRLQSSCQLRATGKDISVTGFDASSWHRVDIPATVVAALVADKTYPDPDYGTNLQSMPGMNYSQESYFGLQDMPAGSPFRCSWWYRSEFTLPVQQEAKTEWLHFLGINYRANIWINGTLIADNTQVAGTYRSYEFDVTNVMRSGAANAIAIEVAAPGKGDLGITWVDWNPTPPDKNMGIWKEVFLTQSGPVALRNPFVESRLDASHQTAALTIATDLRNVSSRAVSGVLRARIEGIAISQPVTLAPGESRTVYLGPGDFAALRLEHPRVWWPYTMGQPNMYEAALSFAIGNQTSDATTFAFGIREITAELTPEGNRLFRVNGRKVLIRGAAWTPDFLFRWSSEKLDADLAYARDMGLNTLRLEGRLDREEFFEKTDRLGILVMPGWTCCDAWEQWQDWQPEQHEVAMESLASQIRILRKHPSVFVWLNGSDNPPPADIEKSYLEILNRLRWPNPVLSSASGQVSTLSGKSGVKMTGPYDYVPPMYWTADTRAGGAFGYNTETSPGPAIPPRGSLERFIPGDRLWPINDTWAFHAGGGHFTSVNVFTDGLTRRYGRATSLDDYLRKSQAISYDGERAMFEAYARNKYSSTGVIQWLMNNAWPSVIWHLYDYYLVPTGGYFGTKKACEPVHLQYSYDDNSVVVVNSTDKPLSDIRVSAAIYNLDASEKTAREVTLNLLPDSNVKAFALPPVVGLTRTYFLRLKLQDAGGKLVSDNFYWLSTKPDTMAWEKSDWAYTPQEDFGDLAGLETLPQVDIETKATARISAGRATMLVRVKNPSRSVAFMVHLRLTRGKGGEEAVPILWEDNYFSVLPGEERAVTAAYDVSILRGANPALEVDGFNVVTYSRQVGAKATARKVSRSWQ
jgi:exo-1,4-beta-D-glucosaminidase